MAKSTNESSPLNIPKYSGLSTGAETVIVGAASVVVPTLLSVCGVLTLALWSCCCC